MRSRRRRSVLDALLRSFLAQSRAERRGVAGEAAVANVLRRLFAEVANDLILPDGRGGLTQVDHLVLTRAGLLVIETKNYRGVILGGAYERTWTQVVGPQRNQFQNPLRQNHAHVEAVKSLAPGVPVLGRVVFLDGARFPKGVPDGVVMLEQLYQNLAGLPGAGIPPPTVLGWERVLRFALTGAAARRAHLEGLKERHAEGDTAARAGALTNTAGVIRPEVRRAPTTPAWPLPSIRRLGLRFAVALIGLWLSLVWLGKLVSHGEKPPPSVAGQPHPAAIVSAIARPAPRPTPTVRPSAPSSHPTRPSPLPTHPSPHPGPSTPASSRPRAVVTTRAPITWSDPSTASRQSEACTLAIVAVLIENTAENRRLRNQACR